MRLKVVAPTSIILDEEVVKVVAEAENGLFCLLPRHIDVVAALVPGILAFVTKEGREGFAAVDEGILIKVGGEVLVSTRSGLGGSELGILRETLEQEYRQKGERERKALAAGARLEADIVRKFMELGGHGR